MTLAYDWGLDQPPDPAAKRADDVDGLTAEQLPEVRELTGLGWQLAPNAPGQVFLPAVWPRELRTWVPDRATRYEWWYEQDPKTHRVIREQMVRSSWESRDEVENDHDWSLARIGITDRPRGRLWLLKPPSGYDSVDAVLDEVRRRAEGQGIDAEMSEAFVQLTARTVRGEASLP
ncbi:hypothetical protein EEZ25_33540 [Micromonospora aurantiaca]|uniref:DUF5956 family protein n=1 Tax=Micromonospora aurantiaca (nom. illeg.) TaxID=47850 RepID=UPI000F417C56|nr:DUF5956 family protein [Micromonospora aurantiaca]RNH92875.1 hypothetical protein EEZ25_33540 [Micromonospora aurantiaca]